MKYCITGEKRLTGGQVKCFYIFLLKIAISWQVLVFEDAPNGIDAAHAAGMKCVWVPHAEQDRDTHNHKCDLVLDSLEHFKPEMFGLPPFDSLWWQCSFSICQVIIDLFFIWI